ncbi:cupin domain-containing protein [Flavobacterium zepuense]|uniref:Cupin domain-containing protein n=1 Tax=Flavobacterium zepuense TaxID=2593302 RepID=A0A552VAD4_9FLAO|nr:cupin domain-containing protein [Flavobacterium zepuense]TRW27441.1 cupin domain-containing protein [Flavobacterium zepuense]
MQPKTYHNPINGEYTTILESSEATNGAYTHFEVTLQAGGGNPVHYHTKFTEAFTAVAGKLGLQKGTKTVYLEPGERLLVPVRSPHRFFNDNTEPITFRVKLTPGQPNFENFLKVMFGLVNDGKTITKNQIPKNIYHIAVVFVWGDTHLTNPLFRLFSPLVLLFYKRAVKLGIDKKLLEKYCG